MASDNQSVIARTKDEAISTLNRLLPATYLAVAMTYLMASLRGGTTKQSFIHNRLLPASCLAVAMTVRVHNDDN